MTTTAVILFVMALIVGVWYVVELGQQNVANFNEYESLYLYCKHLVRNYEVNDHNYKFIMKQLTALGQLKHKNKEKTHVLSCEFWRRFETERKKAILQVDSIHEN